MKETQYLTPYGSFDRGRLPLPCPYLLTSKQRIGSLENDSFK